MQRARIAITRIFLNGKEHHAEKFLVPLVVALLLVGWLLNTPPGLLGKADALGYAVCHRIDVRSFHLGERQLPLCARCSGMYLGAMLGLAYQGIIWRRRAGMPSRSVIVLCGLLVAAFGIDGVNSYFHLFPGFTGIYEPQNWLRLLTGSGMGLVVAAFLFPAFNQTVWQGWDSTPALGSLRSLAPLVLLVLALDAIVLTENPLVLYPLALISAAGVLVLLTMVYTMLWLMARHMENRFQTITQLIIPIIGGLGIALMQVIALDVVRYLFTGSWDGFHLG
jgi:uncharacterized membrane protein